MKKKLWLIAAMITVLALLFVTCGDDDKDTRVTLTAGPAVNIDAGLGTADVTFTGAAGLSLTNADFSVVSNDDAAVTIGTVAINDGTATVTVTFPANEGADKQYVIGIAGNSKVIKGSGRVNINHAGVSLLSPNAWELDVLQGTGGGGDNKRWVFAAEGEAPHDAETYVNSKFLVIATVGGGRIADGTTLDPTTAGYEAIEIEFAGQGTDWGTGWATTRVKPQTENWIVPFVHTVEETVYFVYDLGAFEDLELGEFTADDNFEVRFVWDVAVLALGEYKAYLTDANLVQASGDAPLKMDNSANEDWLIPNNTVFGWITKNPVGLVLPIELAPF
jgi:hypothetical protein